MTTKFWGGLLMLVGAVGVLMSVVSFAVYGFNDYIDMKSVVIYGALGLCIFIAGLEFRRMTTH